MKFRAYMLVAALVVATLAPYSLAQSTDPQQNPNPTGAPPVTGTQQKADPQNPNPTGTPPVTGTPQTKDSSDTSKPQLQSDNIPQVANPPNEKHDGGKNDKPADLFIEDAEPRRFDRCRHHARAFGESSPNRIRLPWIDAHDDLIDHPSFVKQAVERANFHVSVITESLVDDGGGWRASVRVLRVGRTVHVYPRRHTRLEKDVRGRHHQGRPRTGHVAGPL